MPEPVIRAELLTKRYSLVRERSLLRASRRLLPGGRARATPAHREVLHALDEVSFEVAQGEKVGVIGRNGAGKSTLLKILARIVRPTRGRAEIRGRVGALLEVGTGFHPELTGRQNVFLNGAILGMRRREIAGKFDEIVAFSELERFVDLPVKHYSSGMYTRLAFSIAAHLETDILLVDEVLAVGDVAFQRKCFGKMNDLVEHGRTVLFVSHNTSAVTRLCTRAILLENGRLVEDGPSSLVVAKYVERSGGSAQRSWPLESAPGTDELRLLSVEVLGPDGERVVLARVQQSLTLRIAYRTLVPRLQFRCAALFYTQGVLAFATLEPRENERVSEGEYRALVTLPPNLLAEAEYSVSISIFASRGAKLHYVQQSDAVIFQVADPMDGDSARFDYAGRFLGVVRPLLSWETRFVG